MGRSQVHIVWVAISSRANGLLLRRQIEEEARKYDQFDVGYNHWNPLVRYFLNRKLRRAQRAVRLAKNSRILDVGCGDGVLLLRLKGEHTCVGLDISSVRLRRAHKRAPDALLICADACYLPLKESYFDTVFCLDTIEHVRDPEKCTLELERVTKRHVVVTIPDERNLAVARLLSLKLPAKLQGREHLSSVTPNDLGRMFRSFEKKTLEKIPLIFALDYLLVFQKKLIFDQEAERDLSMLPERIGVFA